MPYWDLTDWTGEYAVAVADWSSVERGVSFVCGVAADADEVTTWAISETAGVLSPGIDSLGDVDCSVCVISWVSDAAAVWVWALAMLLLRALILVNWWSLLVACEPDDVAVLTTVWWDGLGGLVDTSDSSSIVYDGDDVSSVWEACD